MSWSDKNSVISMLERLLLQKFLWQGLLKKKKQQNKFIDKFKYLNIDAWNLTSVLKESTGYGQVIKSMGITPQ